MFPLFGIVSYQSSGWPLLASSYSLLEGHAHGPAGLIHNRHEALLLHARNPEALPSSLALGGLERVELGEHGRGAVFAVL